MEFRSLFLVPNRWISRTCVLSKILGKASKSEIVLKPNKEVPVETDTHKLATYVCGTNLFIEGGEDVKIKPDSEYPEWLWSKGLPQPLEKLDKNSKAYWIKLKEIREEEKKYLDSLCRNKTVHK